MRTITIYGIIGDEYCNHAMLSAELALAASKGERVLLKINSPGGSVFEASAMLEELRSYPYGVEANVIGQAYSAASWLLMGVKMVRMAPHAVLMIHNPQFGAHGESGELKSVTEMLDKIKAGFVKLYQSRTKMSAEALAEMMDKTTFLTAEQAVEMGFADEVMDYSLERDEVENVYEVLNFYNQKKEDMSTNAQEMEALRAELQKAQNENKALKDQLDAQNKARAKEVVNMAVQDGRITEGQADAWEKMAVANLEDTTKLINGLVAKKEATAEEKKEVETKVNPQKLEQQAAAGAVENAGKSADPRDAWNMRDWERNDPKNLLKMKREEPARYNELFNAFYKK